MRVIMEVAFNFLIKPIFTAKQQRLIGFCGLSSAMGLAVFTHKIGIVDIVESFGMFEVQIFPLEKNNQ